MNGRWSLYRSSAAARYGVAVLLAGIVIAFRVALRDVPGQNLLVAFVPLAIFASACFGGLGPGLLTTALGGGAAVYFLDHLTAPLGIDRSLAALNIIVSVAVGVLISMVAESMHAARRRAELSASELRRQDEALRISERRFRSLAAATFEGIALSENGRIVDANQQYADLYGYTLNEIIGMEISELVAPQDRERVTRLIEGNFESLGEYLNIRKDGTVFPVEARSRIMDVDGRKVRITALHDLSSRKAAEQAIRDGEIRYSQIIENAHEGIWITDVDGLTTYVNPQMAAILGCTVAEMLGRPAVEYIFEGDRSRAAFEIRRIRAGRDFERAVRLKRKDGREVWCLVNPSLVKDASGEVTGLFGMFSDITELKRYEDKLRRTVEESRRARDLLQTIIETVPAGVVLAEKSGKFTLVNPEARKILGAGWEGDFHGLPGRVGIFRPDGSPFPSGELPLFRAIEHGETSYDVEVLIRRPDGYNAVLLTAGAPLRGQDGEIWGAATVFQNITERKSLEDDLRRTMQELKTASAAKDHFLAILSHELRTPLTPVLMTVSALEDDASLPSSVREDMRVVRYGLELEIRLINDLLDLNRISRGKLQLCVETIDALGKLNEALKVCELELRQKGITLVTDFRVSESLLTGDGTRLQQVFWNLLKNAVKFTPKGGRIHVSCWNPKPTLLCVEIADNGVGIDPALLPRLFEAFEQGGGEMTRRFGGLGLGLTISKALIQMHGGTIRAHSPGRNQGATFTVELPVESISFRDPPPPPEEVQTPKKLRILLVEDHAVTAEVIRKLLQKMGHSVQAVGTFHDAAEAGKNNSFDLLISDIGLPDRSGIDLIAELRCGHPDLKGIALSGYGMETDVQRSLDAGYAEHLIKPVDLARILAAVNRVVAEESSSLA